MISIIIPYYNKSATIAKTLQSIKRAISKCKPLYPCQLVEIIIVNDGSVAEQRKILEDSIDLVKLKCCRIVDQENKGVSSARNRGVAESKFNYIYFLDADDTLLETFFEDCIDKVNGMNCSLFFDLKILRKKISHNLIGRVFLDEKIFFKLIVSRCLHLSNIVFFKGELLPFNEKVSVGEDLLYIYENIINRDVYFCKGAVATYRYDGKFHFKGVNGLEFILSSVQDAELKNQVVKSINERNYLSNKLFDSRVKYNKMNLSLKIKLIGFFQSKILYSFIQKIRFLS
ncbi:glycosyltransferase family 2 protein [Kluyvera sp. CHPC 1.2972]|uniref:glycosyltransferase family 2 protein n=1 Tax=Kluyvera sp. CHPC 1.2972 TaxID=2995176 RepID=UPI002FD87793